jgi:DNA-directed RNA polymerase alpha subunit
MRATDNPADPFDQLLSRLASPARRALASAGIHSLEQLAGCSEKEILALHGIGKNALVVILESLGRYGMSLRADR